MARPLAFDPQEKLHQAMLLFWRKGYESTSVQDLVDEDVFGTLAIHPNQLSDAARMRSVGSMIGARPGKATGSARP